MTQTYLLVCSKLVKNKKFLCIVSSLCVLLLLIGLAAAVGKSGLSDKIAVILLIVPFVSCFYLCATMNRLFYESHLLPRGVRRQAYFGAGLVSCGFPSFLLLLLAWLSFVILQSMSPSTVQETEMNAMKAGLVLVMLSADLFLLLSLSLCSGLFGYKFSTLAIALFPLALSFKPQRMYSFLQLNYSFPNLMIDPLRSSMYVDLGGHLHIVENLAFGALALTVTLIIFLKRDIG